jgi:sulfate adenylyltransferase
MTGAVWLLTGLSGAGKSTLAAALVRRLAPTPVTLLDGDAIRSRLCPDLGFSREDRLRNLSRMAFVAAEVVRHGGLVVCAAIAPYAAGRQAFREDIEAVGGRFFEIHIATPLAECERRDVKGLYARARKGEIAHFTGLDDPFEAPTQPDLRLGLGESVEDGVGRLRGLL